MVRHGDRPYLECSSRGDNRFSAFFARLPDGVSIEELYQASKIFSDGSTGLSIREAKGRHPVNIIDVRELYSRLWDLYISRHPELMDVLVKVTGLSDQFGQPGHACQATELWRIRSEAIQRNLFR